MLSIADKFLKLTKQLYPTGRVFNVQENGTLEKLHVSLIESEVQAYNDALAIFYSLLPDNDNFTVDDATDWERRLGLITNSLVSLADRKAAILRKLRFPGTNPAKQHYLYLENQLQLAGFDVYVFENRFPDYPDGYITKSPIELGAPSSVLEYVQHGTFEHGENEHGYVYNNKIANHIDEEKDLYFDIGNNFRSTFFIGGNPLGTYAEVPTARKNEFRQLVLKLKPVQTVALTFINYI